MINKKILLASALFCSTAFAGLRVQPLPSVIDSLETLRLERERNAPDPQIAFKFFEEDIAAGGYEYVYPEDSRVYIPENSGRNGEVALAFELNANAYSGGAIVLYGVSYDLSEIVYNGALEFWVRGTRGGEECFIVLADDEAANGVKTAVRVRLSDYGGIYPYWTKISIPLADFGRRGNTWNPRLNREEPNYINWSTIKEFGVTIEKNANPEFLVYIDDIFIRREAFPHNRRFDEPYWDELKHPIVNHPMTPPEPVVVQDTLFRGRLEGNMFVTQYGGRSISASHPTTQPHLNDSIMALYFDNSDHAGITLNLGKNYDVTNLRNTGGGLAFWAKVGPGTDRVNFVISDDESNGRAVGTNINLYNFGTLDTNWNYFMIPFREFSEDGSYWDMDMGASRDAKVDFSRIRSMGFTTSKYINRVNPGDPAIFYIDDVVTIKSVPGYIDPEIYWDNFYSDAPDKLLFDFEDGQGGWLAISGDRSSLSYTIADQDDRNLRDRFGRKYKQLNYTLNDWAFSTYNFVQNSSPSEKRDWSQHNAIAFDVHSPRDEEILSIRVNDEGDEEWWTRVELSEGWNSVVVPFRRFRKNQNYQVPSAREDGVFDLDGVRGFSLEPATMGVSGVMLFDNIRLINIEE